MVSMGIHDFDDDDDEKYALYRQKSDTVKSSDEDTDSFVDDIKDDKITKKPGFKIQVTADDGAVNSNAGHGSRKKSKKRKSALFRQKEEEERLKQMLDEETISKLLSLELPEEVSSILGEAKQYKLPKEKDDLENLERDLRKMAQ
eukprot:278869_1